jgi:hypothetical protein
LEQAKELVLIMPVAKKQITCKVIGTLFRHEKKQGTKIFCRYFTSGGVAKEAFQVAMEDEGRYEKMRK